MKRYFVQIAYDGTHYHGWQVQPNANTVQHEINKVFNVLTGVPDLETVGCGRTDTGVHASHFFIHFDLEESLPEEFVYKANKMLPKDISVERAFEVGLEDHARFSASSRRYLYFIHTAKNPFRRHYSLYHPHTLNITLMNEACRQLLKYVDFESFSKVHTDVNTFNCQIMEAFWTEGNGAYIFNIKADRFLRNMVRAIVGTMLEVGTGKISVSEFCEIIEAKDRGRAGKSVGGQGLFLSEVSYPFLETSIET